MRVNLGFLIAAKVILLTGVGILLYHQFNSPEIGIASTTTSENINKKAGNASENKDGEGFKIPDIPQSGFTLNQAQEIKKELEFMRKDIVNKIDKLKIAKAGYDKAKNEVNVKIKKVTEERKLLEDTLQKEKKIKEDRLKETTEYVLKMEPRKAAPIIESMDRDLVIAMFQKLPPKLVTRIFEAMSAQKATTLMEYYTRVRSAREFEIMKDLSLCKPHPDLELTPSPSLEPTPASANPVPTSTPAVL